MSNVINLRNQFSLGFSVMDVTQQNDVGLIDNHSNPPVGRISW